MATKDELKRYRVETPNAFPIQMREIEAQDEYGFYSTGIFSYKGMYIIVNIECGLWHLSVSAKFPLGYMQIKDVRYMFLPNGITVAQIFPPREEFVNLHETCYHLWEIDGDYQKGKEG